MPNAFSLDLRERVWRAHEQGNSSQPQVAEQFGVSASFVRDLVRRRRETGSLAPKPHGGGHPPALDKKGLEHLAQAVARKSDATLEEPGRGDAPKTQAAPEFQRGASGVEMAEAHAKKRRPCTPAKETPHACDACGVSTGSKWLPSRLRTSSLWMKAEQTAPFAGFGRDLPEGCALWEALRRTGARTSPF